MSKKSYICRFLVAYRHSAFRVDTCSTQLARNCYWLAWIIHEVSSQNSKDALKGNEHWGCGPCIPFRSIHRLIQSVLPQLSFSFYRHQPIHADFSGGQITSDAGLLPLRAFDQRHHLTSDWAVRLSDPRQDDRVRHDSLALLRQRV